MSNDRSEHVKIASFGKMKEMETIVRNEYS
jgi:hypothetical protein